MTPTGAAGTRTTAVVPGRRTAEIGFALWAASTCLALVLAIMGIVVEPSLIPVHLVLIPVLLVHYRILVIGKRSSFRAVIVLAAARLLPCGAFVLT